LPIFLMKGNIVTTRIPIGSAYAQPVKVVFSGGFEPPVGLLAPCELRDLDGYSCHI
jgi:hypothetical protein